MQSDMFPPGGPSYQRFLADLAARAKENPARPNRDPMADWTPPSLRTADEVTLDAEPEVEETGESEAPSLTFNPFTERWE